MHTFAPPNTSERLRGAAYGAMAGMIAANLMTVFRALAQRAGVIEKTVPQSMEERLTDEVGVNIGKPLAHHALDQAMHVGYAAALGAMTGFVTGSPGAFSWARGLTVGAGTWAAGAGVLMPALRAGDPPWRASLGENAVNLGAHLLFGVGQELMLEQLAAQTDHGPVPAQSGRVG